MKTAPAPQTIVRLHPALKARAQAFCQQSEATLTMNALMRQALIEKLDREDGKAELTMTERDFRQVVRSAVLRGKWSDFEFENHDRDNIAFHVLDDVSGYEVRVLAQILGGGAQNIVATNVVETIDDFNSTFLEEILTPTELQSVRTKMNAGFEKLTER